MLNDIFRYKAFIFIAIISTLFGCSSAYVNNEFSSVGNNKYDSEFPNKSVSKELKYISTTVKKLDVLAFYSNHYFPNDSSIRKIMISDSLLKLYSVNSNITHESVSGTASVIYANGDNIGLLTCAHVIDFKDTVYTYYKTGNKGLHSISIKIKQQNHVSGLEAGEPIKIIAVDNKLDIALLIKKAIPFDKVVTVLKYPTGDINDLQWGSLVYIMGYPLGNLMVTRAIVSVTNKMKSGTFVTDALYNHGISGSPVFAIRDGVPNFELVGMATSAAALETNMLVADDKFKDSGRQIAPYFGEVFVDNSKLISYGVTYSVSINKIRNFMRLNKMLLEENGFDLNYFFK